jgi:hypothetical protein
LSAEEQLQAEIQRRLCPRQQQHQSSGGGAEEVQSWRDSYPSLSAVAARRAAANRSPKIIAGKKHYAALFDLLSITADAAIKSSTSFIIYLLTQPHFAPLHQAVVDAAFSRFNALLDEELGRIDRFSGVQARTRHCCD